MSEGNTKLKSKGFASYVPPGRRAVNSEVQAQNTEKTPTRRASKSLEKQPIINTLDAAVVAVVTEPEDNNVIKTPKSPKSPKKGGLGLGTGLGIGVPREYVPPGRRNNQTDAQKTSFAQISSDSKVIQSSGSTEVATIATISQNKNTEMTIENSTDEDKIAKKARKFSTELPRGNYVPPARRAIIAQELKLEAEAEALGIKKIIIPKIIPKKCEGYVIPPVPQQYYEENIQDEYSVQRCCYIVRGLPPELPDLSKDRYLKPFGDKGAIIRWISPDEALLVFSTETLAKSAFLSHKNSLIKIICLQDLGEDELSTYLSVSTEIYNSIKPERDCRVANRMISAALGISLPKRLPMPIRAKSPKKLDAWDD